MNIRMKQWIDDPLVLLAGLVVGWSMLMRLLLLAMIIGGSVYWFKQQARAE